MVKVDNKRQPVKASMLPGKIKGNAAASQASSMAKSNLPGGFISMEAGADPSKNLGLNNGPAGDASATSFQMGDGQKKRTVTGVCQSPYDVK